MPPIAAAYKALCRGVPFRAAAAAAAAAADRKGSKRAFVSAAGAAEAWIRVFGGAAAAPQQQPHSSLLFAVKAVAAASGEAYPCCCCCCTAESSNASATAAADRPRSTTCPEVYRHLPVLEAGSVGWRQPLPSVFVPIDSSSSSSSMSAYPQVQRAVAAVGAGALFLPMRLLQQLQQTDAATLLRCTYTSALAFVRPSGFFLPVCTVAVVCLAMLLQFLKDKQHFCFFSLSFSSPP